jgi:hypothetical protein
LKVAGAPVYEDRLAGMWFIRLKRKQLPQINFYVWFSSLEKTNRALQVRSDILYRMWQCLFVC